MRLKTKFPIPSQSVEPLKSLILAKIAPKKIPKPRSKNLLFRQCVLKRKNNKTLIKNKTARKEKIFETEWYKFVK
jgi:hypothetical protein